jgi:hypothetical protein
MSTLKVTLSSQQIDINRLNREKEMITSKYVALQDTNNRSKSDVENLRKNINEVRDDYQRLQVQRGIYQ